MGLPDPNDDNAGDVVHVADAFLEQSYLTYIIPFATAFSPQEALGQGAGAGASPGAIEAAISAIEQRDQLFFDETVDVYFILRAPYADDRTLRSHLRRLVVNLDAHIVNGVDRDGPSASETVYNGAAEGVDDAFLVADPPDQDAQRHVYAIWKMPVFLGRPRMRLQMPSVVLSGAASFNLNSTAPDHFGVPGGRGGYMQSCAPSGMNLLESFATDPLLGGTTPRLSAQRVSKVAPLTKPADDLYRLSGLQTLKLKIFPVLHTRVRFSRPNTTPPSAAMIALVEVDFTPYFDCEVSLDKLTLDVTDGTVEDLNCQDGMRPPLSCVAHDHLTFLYNLAPRKRDLVPKNLARDLVITIEILVLVRPADEPNPCTPRLTMTWTTALDFTPPVNPGFGQPKTTPIQRSHRPSQLSISGGVDSQPLVSPSVIRPDALPSLEAATASPLETALPDFGITMTFTGPPKPVVVGEEFTWSVFVVNRSKPHAHLSLPPPSAPPNHVPSPSTSTAPHHHHPPTAAARKLMLLPLPRRRRTDLRVIRPPSTATAPHLLPGSTKRDPLIADAVLDEAVVHAMQRGSVVDAAELVCLSPDARVGPLAPGACAVVALRFVALREGVIGLEAVRVVDLGSGEHVDVRELPVVVAVAGEGGG
ncbi:TRAPP trafficking subunit Trs65-domain-containing protein [Staphylotrichum tortipilum]|uniref:TRAPP trafficking subunit Trs65-domain-containing protein n=1 Tax=Staphylotrichum tortipilum TaxID=2831512 RepID=A0AAN6MIG7_9PEZI|nr:TRAPP trafficking subunit Trs65-domain-containing protein [Staphylotrichum longicolle]